MSIRIPVNAPKGQKLIAQGNTLGELDTQLTPCRGKSPNIITLLPLQGEITNL